jgi:hypothetical protein
MFNYEQQGFLSVASHIAQDLDIENKLEAAFLRRSLSNNVRIEEGHILSIIFFHLIPKKSKICCKLGPMVSQTVPPFAR